MAIARGAGTEIIRTHAFSGLNSTYQDLIVGVQHHVYTVLSIVCYANSVDTANNWILVNLIGYDSKAGSTQGTTGIFKQDMNNDQTYVWNDKFSFNGYEPIDFTGPLSTAVMQDAIVDQGSGVKQILRFDTQGGSDHVDVLITFIDQNNA